MATPPAPAATNCNASDDGELAQLDSLGSGRLDRVAGRGRQGSPAPIEMRSLVCTQDPKRGRGAVPHEHESRRQVQERGTSAGIIKRNARGNPVLTAAGHESMNEGRHSAPSFVDGRGAPAARSSRWDGERRCPIAAAVGANAAATPGQRQLSSPPLPAVAQRAAPQVPLRPRPARRPRRSAAAGQSSWSPRRCAARPQPLFPCTTVSTRVGRCMRFRSHHIEIKRPGRVPQ